jgi:hypothetical protein
LIISDNIGLDWRRPGNSFRRFISQYSPYSQKCGEVRGGMDFHFSFPEVIPALVVGNPALINFLRTPHNGRSNISFAVAQLHFAVTQIPGTAADDAAPHMSSMH